MAAGCPAESSCLFRIIRCSAWTVLTERQTNNNNNNKQPSTYLRTPSTYLRTPSTYLRTPSTYLRTPSTYLRTPSTYLRTPSTYLRTPSTYLRTPSTYLRTPSTYLRTPSTYLRTPSTYLRTPSTYLRTPSTYLRTPSTYLRTPSTYLRTPSGEDSHCSPVVVGWLVGCLTSQQHASVSQGRICSDKCTCCHTEIEAADQTFYLTQSQYADTGPTSPSADPITLVAWQGSRWCPIFKRLV